MYRTIRSAWLVVLLSVVAIAGNAVAQETAGVRVEMFQRDILGIMKQADRLPPRERYRLLKPVLREHVHLGAMVATASAPYFRRGMPEQRRRLIEAFTHMGSSLVASMLSGYDNETFRVVRLRKAGASVVLVDSQMVASGDQTDVTYVVASVGGRWWIVDIVIAGGISEVKVLRAEYRKLLNEGGLDKLATVLRGKGDKILAGQKGATVSSRE